jgi:hypothetical protein
MSLSGLRMSTTNAEGEQPEKIPELAQKWGWKREFISLGFYKSVGNEISQPSRWCKDQESAVGQAARLDNNRG